MDEQDQNVRSLIIAALVLVSPLPLEGFIDEGESSGYEVLLQDGNDGIWAQDEWGELNEFGYIPLRLLSPNTLVAWKNDVASFHPEAREYGSPNALWKFIPNEGETVRIVFEPGLPTRIVEDLRVQLQETYGVHLSPIQSGHVASIDMVWDSSLQMDWFEHFPGILWLEPQGSTAGRNLDSATLLSGSSDSENPLAWKLGLNGSGVVIGVADTGIDSDHSCFRNVSDTSIGENHRKLLFVNTTIDDWDSAGHNDYRHGTHTAGILGCHPIATALEENVPSALMSLGYNTKLVVQDIVSEEGWLPPDVDLLLAESAMYGGYLHSNSWGDDTTDYTLRSADFDAFTREFPWTLPIIAPGNDGGFVLEPANARNVVAIGASTKDPVTERWMSSVHGPTDAETRGIFALAPGISITSARSDGSPDSYNAGHHTLSGTSMSTPMAATYASILQQMVQDGWVTGHNETLREHTLQSQTPWFDSSSIDRSVLLGEGFVPSAPLMKALMSISTTSLTEEYRNGGNGGSLAPNNYDGWGVLNLSTILDFENLTASSSEISRPIPNLWVHDSYRLLHDVPSEHIKNRDGNEDPIENLMQNTWDGSGAVGPFLSTGDVFQQRFILQKNEPLDIQLSFQAKPEPHLVEDIQLMVQLPDGRFAVGEDYRHDGRSQLYYDFANPFNTTAFPPTNETTVGIHLDAETLDGIDFIDVIVTGRYVSPGNLPETVGIEGDRVGFGLAVKGVEIDPLNHSDGDADGVPYEQDSCPFTNAYGWDLDGDGCIDDTDEDGVNDDSDSCPMTPSLVPVDSVGCSQQNQAPRIFLDESTLHSHDNETISVLFSVLDEDNVTTSVVFERYGNTIGVVEVCSELISNDSWKRCSVNVSQDFFPLSAGGNWTVYIIAEDDNSSSWTAPATSSYRSGIFTIKLPELSLEDNVGSRSPFSTTMLASIATALALAIIAQFWIYNRNKKEN